MSFMVGPLFLTPPTTPAVPSTSVCGGSATHVEPLDRVQLQRHNGCDMVLLAGQHNQHQPYVLDTFRWLSEEAPGSYGLLFIHDAEAQNDNAFVIWRLCRGELTEHTDPFLSPCIPTIEDPYQGE